MACLQEKPGTAARMWKPLRTSADAPAFRTRGAVDVLGVPFAMRLARLLASGPHHRSTEPGERLDQADDFLGCRHRGDLTRNSPGGHLIRAVVKDSSQLRAQALDGRVCFNPNRDQVGAGAKRCLGPKQPRVLQQKRRANLCL